MTETTSTTNSTDTVEDTIDGVEIVTDGTTTVVTDDNDTPDDDTDDTTTTTSEQRLKLAVTNPATALTLGLATSSGGDNYGAGGVGLYSSKSYSAYTTSSAYFRTGTGDYTRRAYNKVRDISDNSSYENVTKEGTYFATRGEMKLWASGGTGYSGGESDNAFNDKLADVVVKGKSSSQTYEVSAASSEEIRYKTASFKAVKILNTFQGLSWAGHDLYTFIRNGIMPLLPATAAKAAGEAYKVGIDTSSFGIPSSPAGIVSNSAVVTVISAARAFVHGLEAIGNVVFGIAGIAAFATAEPLFGASDTTEFAQWMTSSGNNVNVYGEDGVSLGSARTVTSFGIWGVHSNAIYRASMKAIWSSAVKSWIDTTIFGGASVHVSSLGVTKITGKWLKLHCMASMEQWCTGTFSMRSAGAMVVGSNSTLFVQGVSSVDMNGGSVRILGGLSLDLASNVAVKVRSPLTTISGGAVNILGAAAPGAGVPGTSPGMVVTPATVTLSTPLMQLLMSPASLTLAAAPATLTMLPGSGAVLLAGSVINVQSTAMINLM